MPKYWSYDIDTLVIPNEKAPEEQYRKLPGRVVELHEGLQYDYIVRFSPDDEMTFKEEELDFIDYKAGDPVEYDNMECEFVMWDFENSQVEILFPDGVTLDVVPLNKIKLISKQGEGKLETVNFDNHALHKKVLDEIHETYKIKNSDYGNSFGEQFEEYGLLSLVIRLDDKMRRLKQLLNNEAKVKDESILDTILDMSNYGIMGVMELQKDAIRSNKQHT